MKMASSVVFILLLTLLTSGCETTSETKNLSWQSAVMTKYSVDIMSEPSGVIVEINNNFVGKTPITVELEGWEGTRTFSRSHVIVAHPLKSGGYTQIKVFTGWSEPSATYGDTIPETIYFNMSLQPMPEKHEIEINK